MTTLAADVEQFHAGLGASLLRLEEDGFFMLATGAGLVGSRERWVGANILRDTGRLTGRGVEDVAEDAGGLGVLGVLAGPAGELQLVRIHILLGVEHVGALGAETKCDLLKLLVARGVVVRSGGLGGGHCGRSQARCNNA